MNMETRHNILAMLESESDAIEIWQALCDRFGWAGTFFTRSDVESAWNGYENINDPHIDLPDEVWEKVQDDWVWTKGLTDRLCEIGFDMINELMSEIYMEADYMEAES